MVQVSVISSIFSYFSSLVHFYLELINFNWYHEFFAQLIDAYKKVSWPVIGTHLQNIIDWRFSFLFFNCKLRHRMYFESHRLRFLSTKEHLLTNIKTRKKKKKQLIKNILCKKKAIFHVFYRNNLLHHKNTFKFSPSLS